VGSRLHQGFGGMLIFVITRKTRKQKWHIERRAVPQKTLEIPNPNTWALSFMTDKRPRLAPFWSANGETNFIPEKT